MAINKDSNGYTLTFAIVLVVVVDHSCPFIGQFEAYAKEKCES